MHMQAEGAHGCEDQPSGYSEFGHWLTKRRGNRLGLHHNRGIELVYIAAGSPTWEVDGRREHIAPHSLFFTMPWHLHGAAHADELGLEMWWLVVPILGDQHNWRFAPDLQLPCDDQLLQRFIHSFAHHQHCFEAHDLLGRDLQHAVGLLRAHEVRHERVRARVWALLCETLHVIESHAADAELHSVVQ